MLEPIITGSQRASFVKEYNDRQSPLVVWGSSGAEESAFWNLTSGKAEFVTTSGVPITPVSQ